MDLSSEEKVSSFEETADLYDSKSRIDNVEVFCNNKWHYFSGKKYSPEFHSKLNKYIDTQILEVIQSGKIDANYLTNYLNSLRKISDKEPDQIKSITTKYGTELKIDPHQSCPTGFSMVNLFAKNPSDLDTPCIKICFSGEVTSETPTAE